jgi:hypothetical protein
LEAREFRWPKKKPQPNRRKKKQRPLIGPTTRRRWVAAITLKTEQEATRAEQDAIRAAKKKLALEAMMGDAGA